MTATDPRPALAAALAARLAPAAEALAAAYAEDASLELPPPDERARADHHRAGCAQLAHLRQLLAVLDWAGAQLPEPERDLVHPRAGRSCIARPSQTAGKVAFSDARP